MTKRSVIDMPKLYQLRDKGYRAETIALIMGVPYETVRTILGGLENESLYEVKMEMERFRKCA